MKIMKRHRKIAQVCANSKAEALEALDMLADYIEENYGDEGRIFEQVTVSNEGEA